MTTPHESIASEIATLINSQPRSPTADEIRAVVAKHVVAPPKIAATVLTYGEFEALMKWRGSHCDLSAHEKRPDDVSVVWVDPLVLFLDREEQRSVSGMLENPPRIYVVRYDDEYDSNQLLPLRTVKAIEPFAPLHVREMWRRVQEFRAAAGKPTP